MHIALSIANILAQSSGDDGAGGAIVASMFGAMAFIFCGFFIFVYAFQIFVTFMAYKLLSAVPPPFRKQEPNLAWLLLIPVFNLIWNFFVWPRISESYAAYAQSIGRTDIHDANGSLALTFCICMAIWWIPYVGWGCLSWIAFVVLIIYLVKMFGLKKQLALTA